MESVVVERDWLITIVGGENHTKLVKKIRNHTQKMLLIPHLRFSQVSSTCKVHTQAQRYRINPLNNFMIRLCFCKINTYIHTYIYIYSLVIIINFMIFILFCWGWGQSQGLHRTLVLILLQRRPQRYRHLECLWTVSSQEHIKLRLPLLHHQAHFFSRGGKKGR